jgi:hypothetical protein
MTWETDTDVCGTPAVAASTARVRLRGIGPPGQHQPRGRRVRCPELRDEVRPVGVRQAGVDDTELDLAAEGERLGARRGLADDDVLLSIDHECRRLADRRLQVDEQDADAGRPSLRAFGHWPKV